VSGNRVVVVLLLSGLAFGLPGCGDPVVSGSETQDDPAWGGVTFVVISESRPFATGSELRARLWSAEQLDALNANSQCSVTRDPTGAEEIHCPDGITYEEVVPEEFTTPVVGSEVRLEFTSERVRVGEEFHLLLTGRSADGCNTTSAVLQSRAGSARIILHDPAWEATLRACATG